MVFRDEVFLHLQKKRNYFEFNSKKYRTVPWRMRDKSRGRCEVDCEVVPTFLDDAPRTFLLIVEMRRSVCGLDSRPVQSLSFAGCCRFYPQR